MKSSRRPSAKRAESKQNSVLPGQLRLLLLLALVYLIGWLTYFGQTAGGRLSAPAEAATIAAALEWSPERPAATAYEWVLRAVASATGPDALRFGVRCLNATALLLATGLMATATGRHWQRNRSLWIGGILVGLNPILVFWSGLFSPVCLAVCLSSLGVYGMLRWHRRGTLPALITPTVSFALAGFFVPACWAFYLTFVPFALLRRPSMALPATLLAALPALLGLAALAALPLRAPLEFNPLGLSGLQQLLATFEFHDGRSASLYNRLHLLLGLNPIHWGLILALAVGGVYAHLKNGPAGRSLILCGTLIAAFALAWWCLGGGAQARLALLPPLAILAGGTVHLPQLWKHGSRPTRRRLVAGALVIACFTYLDFFGIQGGKAFAPEYRFLARAHLDLGQYDAARRWAEKAEAFSQDKQAARALRIEARLRAWALSKTPRPLTVKEAETLLAETAAVDAGRPTVDAIRALYLWKLRENEAANAIWREHAEASALARLSLVWTHQAPPPKASERERFEASAFYELLTEASTVNRGALDNSDLARRLDNLYAYAR